jgi:HPr kinase/phosphorylase
MIAVHASAVAIGSAGVLIRGPSGAGKSDLVLRLIDSPGFGVGSSLLRASLIADDQVVVQRDGNHLFLSPPPAIAGQMELRGIGIIKLSHMSSAQLALVIDLADEAAIERMPAADETTEILGLHVKRYWIDAKTAGATAKIRALIT